MIFSGYITICQIKHIFHKYIIFSLLGKCVSRPGEMVSQDRFGPRAVVWRILIDYEEWWQHTPLSESNTDAERLWFNSVDTGTIFWPGIQLLDSLQEAPVTTVLPRHSPDLLTRYPAIYFPEVDKICIYVFGMLPGFLENLLESGNLFCSATAATKTALGIIQLWFNYFRGSWHRVFLGD